MGKNTIFRGGAANDGTGDNLRLGASKINDNFTELYTAFCLSEKRPFTGTVLVKSEA